MTPFQLKPSLTGRAGTLRFVFTAFVVVVASLVPPPGHAGVGLSGFGIVPNPPAQPPIPPAPVQLPSPSGSEICGIVGSTDNLFADGFESGGATIAVLRTSRSVTKSVSGTGTPTITIVFPAAGQTLAASGTVVTGTFTGPADTGVVVNGVLAYTAGNAFLVPDVPLSTGANTLQATATTLPGLTAQSSVSITRSGTVAPVALASTSLTGFAPFAISFSPVVAGTVTVSQMKVDFDGDGVDDVTTTNPALPLPHTYATPGLYVARLTVIDSTTTPNPTTYVAYARVLVQSESGRRQTAWLR